jgi:hypothetical protein
MWGTKRSKREEEVVEEEEEKEEKEEEEHGAWAECFVSTRPGSTSSADASSCCSATMTDAPLRLCPCYIASALLSGQMYLGFVPVSIFCFRMFIHIECAGLTD